MSEQDDERERRRRINQEATQPFFVPGFRGHWVGVILFAATLTGVTMLYSCLPTAVAVFAGGATGAADGRTATTFFALYAAMAIGPIAGWTLWGFGRRWAALAVAAIFFGCVCVLSPAVAA